MRATASGIARRVPPSTFSPPRRGDRRRASVLSFVLLSGLSPTPVHAQGEDDATRGCAGTFSLVHPMPARCLEDIETDRPHKTDTPHALEPGHVRVELGVGEYAVARWRGRGDDSVGLFNNEFTLGLASHLGPVRRWDVQILHGVGSYAVGARRFRWSDRLLLRSKVNIWDRGVHVTLVPAMAVPLGRGPVEAGGFVFLGTELPWSLEAELNVGSLSETEPGTGQRHATLVVTGALTRRMSGPVSTFVELYTESTTRSPSRWDATLDTGLLLLLSRSWQADAGVYVGVLGDAPVLAPFMGLSTRW